MNKNCGKHGLTEFSGKIRSRCKKCNVEAVTRKRKQLKARAIDHMGGRCIQCSYDTCPGALEFHHIDPTLKDWGISEKGWTRSWARLLEELEKCVLLCSNCHREVHFAFDNGLPNPFIEH